MVSRVSTLWGETLGLDVLTLCYVDREHFASFARTVGDFSVTFPQALAKAGGLDAALATQLQEELDAVASAREHFRAETSQAVRAPEEIQPNLRRSI